MEEYKKYDKSCWDCNSIHTPSLLIKQHPDLVRIYLFSFCLIINFDLTYTFYRWRDCLTQAGRIVIKFLALMDISQSSYPQSKRYSNLVFDWELGSESLRNPLVVKHMHAKYRYQPRVRTLRKFHVSLI